MVISITQHCNLKCPHCMQNASPERQQFMSEEVFDRAIDLAKFLGALTITISGGEPTTHPKLFNFLEKLTDHMGVVTIASNGMFLKDYQLSAKLAEALRRHQNLYIQITSVKGLYANYEYVHKPGLRALRNLGSRAIVCDRKEDVQLKAVGRAASEPCLAEATKNNHYPSCINPCLILRQSPLTQAVAELFEVHSRFCAPVVYWNGDVKLGEAEQCAKVASLQEPFSEIVQKMYDFKPCGKCLDYRRHFSAPSTDKEVAVATLLGLN